MFPLQILSVLSSVLLIYFLVCWFIYFNLESGNCYGYQPYPRNENYASDACEHRIQSCGVSGLNLKYPFRFQADPSVCIFPFNLSCQRDRTVFYPIGYPKEYYYVQSIDYENQTIRLIDPGVQKEDCSTLPLYSLHQYGFSSDLLSIYGFFGDLSLRPKDDANSLVFVSCKNPVKSESKLKFHRLVDTASCNFSAAQFANHENISQVSKTDHHRSSYNYVSVGGNLNVSDIEESCTINKIVPAEIDESLLDETGDDISFQHIHNMLVDGFQLQWEWEYFSDHSSAKKSFGCFLLSILDNLQIINTFLQDPSTIGRTASNGLKGLTLVITARNAIGILILMVFLIYKRHRRHLSAYDSIEEFLQANNSLMPIRYSYREIKTITNNFREKLGEGGYGLVYKGKLRSGSLVAVKMLNKSKANGQEFISEVATIGRIHHVNVVRLVGFCVTASKRALVYEYMPNGSLDKFIFSANLNASSLSWKKAYEIVMGVARGIEYLHLGCNMQILHFDIKPHNILLDENFVPKVSDFGLAKLYPTQDSYVATLTAIRGTIGYIAPELIYKNIGRVSYKADVYSFGMLLMDMAGRWRNANTHAQHSSETSFSSWIHEKLEQMEDIEIGDHMSDEEKVIARKLILIALWCIQMTPTDRPSMREVIEMIESDLEALQFPPIPLQFPPDSPIHTQSCPSSSEECTEPLCGSVTLEIE